MDSYLANSHPQFIGLPVFTFNGTTASSAGPSIAHLDKDLQLPGKFIFCSSVKQARFDNVGFYSVYDYNDYNDCHDYNDFNNPNDYHDYNNYNDCDDYNDFNNYNDYDDYNDYDNYNDYRDSDLDLK